MKYLVTIAGAMAAAIHGLTVAMVVGAIVSQSTSDFLPEIRYIEGALGALGGAFAGGFLAYQGKTHKSYGFGLFARVFVFASSLPLFRLSAYQDEWLPTITFLLLGSSAFLIGTFLILDIALKRGWKGPYHKN